MFYELSAIEWKIRPEQIRKALFQTNRISGPEKKDNRKETPGQHKNQWAYYAILEKFKKIFITEFYRIQTSIRNHKIEDSEPVFIRYITTNYKGLHDLYDAGKANSPPGQINCGSRQTGILFQKAIAEIYVQLQTLFVLPLKNFIESDFKKELIIANLVDSPIETFLKAIRNNKVSVIRHDDFVAAEYKPVYLTDVNRLFTLQYNDHNIEALYNEDLQAVYLEFQSFVEMTLENTPGYMNKIRFLNKLKLRISSVDAFFYKDPVSPDFHSKALKHLRKDASDNLKLKLHKYNISKDFEMFNEILVPLTEVQKIYINKSLKFIKSLLNLTKIYKEQITTEDCQNQDIQNQPPLPVRDYPESSEKLQWRGNINQLITFFYDASTQVLINGKPILNATKKQLVRFLTENFIQKDGDPVNPTTIKTVLTPSKVLKRPPLTKRITIPL